MVSAMLLGLFGCCGNSQKLITSVEEMSLTLRTMGGGCVYQFTDEGDATELRYYREVYSGEETVLVLENSVVCDKQVMIALLNACNIMRWDSFHGKHPKNVTDGTMFVFTAMVNGGKTIYADGSANFPKGYHEFVKALNEMLAAAEMT